MQNNGRQERFLLHSVVSFSFISLNLISLALICLIFVIKLRIFATLFPFSSH